MKKFNYLNTQETMPAPNAVTTWQESVYTCSRCNNCSQSCPSYCLEPQEMFSPRGRVQLTRLLLEGKITSCKQVPSLEKMIRTCLLCARCSEACAAQVPVAHYMAALRQARHITLLPALLQGLLVIYRKWPAGFHWILSLALALHRTRVSFFLYPLFPAWLKHLYQITPFHSVSLRKAAAQNNAGPAPDMLYLPSLYTQYIDGTAGQKILQLSKAKHPLILYRTSSGLEAYLYENRAVCLQTAKKLLVRWENACAKKPLPLLTDSLDIYLFIKNYPFLFQHLPNWKKRAEKLAAHVRFITDLSFSSQKPCALPCTVALDSSSVLYTDQNVRRQAQKIIKTLCGKNLVECEYNRLVLPVAAMSLVKGSPAKKLVARYAQAAAQQHLTDVYCLSGVAALELQAALKATKTTATAKHFIHIITDYGTVQK